MAKKVKLYFFYMLKSLISVVIGLAAAIIVLYVIAKIMGHHPWNPIDGIVIYTIPFFFLKVLMDPVAYFLARLFKVSFSAIYIAFLVAFAILTIIGNLLPNYRFEDVFWPALLFMTAIKPIDYYVLKNRLPWTL